MKYEKRKIYWIDIGDIQTVANDELERDLNPEEIEQIVDLIAEKIPWYDAISESISEKKFR